MLETSSQVKIRIVVPVAHVGNIQEALGNAGAGQIGNYSHCSLSYPVAGQFQPEAGATPAIGEVGTMEHVDEVMVEAVCYKDSIKAVYEAVRHAHPYEEPAIDILPLLTVK